MDDSEFYAAQKSILEDLFGLSWFNKPRKHPAYRRWSLLDMLVRQAGVIHLPSQEGLLPEICRTFLDSCVLASLTQQSLESLTLGDLSGYGDETVQKKIKSRVANPAQFLDLMVEFYVASSFMGNGYEVTPLEKEGWPDFQIQHPDVEGPFFVESKRSKTARQNSIHGAIKHANKQIKATSSTAPGVVVLDVSEPTGFAVVDDDIVPSVVGDAIGLVERALTPQMNRAVGAVVVVWDDYIRMGTPPEYTLIVARRRRQRVMRPNYENLGYIKESFTGMTAGIPYVFERFPSVASSRSDIDRKIE